MGTNYYVVKRKPTITEPLHIGKSSAGWRFLFHEVNKGSTDFDYDLEIHTFEQWRDFLKNNKEIVILDEYDREVDVNELLKLIEDKQNINNLEDFLHSKNVNGYRFSDSNFS